MTVRCNICLSIETTGKKLSNHIKQIHKLSSREYTIQTIFQGEIPKCKICGIPTRYVAFNFKKYCKDHSLQASQDGGKIGGKIKITWNKGKTKETDEKVARLALSLSGVGNHFYGKEHTVETKKRISSRKLLTKEDYEIRLKSRDKEFDVLTPYTEYTSRQRQKLSCKCLKCGLVQSKTLLAFERGSMCIKCFPFITSKSEIDIGAFIENVLPKEHGKILRNDRDILSPKELDIYIPSKNLAIEYNGLYWHKDKKTIHFEKTEACQNKNIQLIHIFSDEWLNKQEIIKSMLLARLGLSPIKIDARKCFVKTIDTAKEAKNFFDRTHVAGYTKCLKVFGLFNSNSELIAALSCRHSFLRQKYNPKDVLEIARFSTELNHNIRGAFGKLLAECVKWAKKNEYSKIISYCDLRFGYGNVYRQTGFDLVSKNTGINYWYSDGKERFNRFKFRATKLKTEKQVALENNIFKVYGCGNSLYELNLNQENQFKVIKSSSKINWTEMDCIENMKKETNNLSISSLNPVDYGSNKKLTWKGCELNKNYVFDLSLEDKEALAKDMFVFYRHYGFPHIVLTDEELREDWETLCEGTLKHVNDNGVSLLSNKSISGNAIVKHFNSKLFYAVRGSKKNERSMITAFEDDDILMKVIRNRLQITFNERFNIHGAMLRQGFRSTRLASVISTFNCQVARFLYKTYLPKLYDNAVVYDFSMGFGHRMLGAISFGNNILYIGVDPWKELCVNNRNMASFFNKENQVKIYNSGSETKELSKELLLNYRDKVDVVFSSPPYFDKEVYDNDNGTQAYSGHDYNKFLNDWWKKTVDTSSGLLKKDGVFIINVVEVLDKKIPILEDMCKILKDFGFSEVERHYLSMSESHFTKHYSKQKLFKNEPIVVFKR